MNPSSAGLRGSPEGARGAAKLKTIGGVITRLTFLGTCAKLDQARNGCISAASSKVLAVHFFRG
jgi:hypothetical protein